MTTANQAPQIPQAATPAPAAGPYQPSQEEISAMTKAKVALMSRADSAFFTSLAFSLIQEFDPKTQTAATNGKYIKYNPAFFMSLTKEERVFLMLHESMHVAYLHMARGKGLDHRKFNRAADYVINQQLHERGFTMPKSGLRDDKYAGMSTEQVYALLPDDPPGDGSGDAWDDLIPSDMTNEQLKEEVQDMLVRAKVQSEMAGDKAGSIPGDIQIFLDKLLNPVLPWQKILQRFFSSFAKTDYSFRKPNRRHFPTFHLPSLYGASLCDLGIAVDISGSVSDHEFKVFVSEIAGILRMQKPSLINLIQFDTEIHHIDKVRSIPELLKCEFTGRGGTMLHEVVTWANKNKPQAMLIFTDGGLYEWPAEKINVPVVWLIHNNPSFTAPYGKVIHYQITQ